MTPRLQAHLDYTLLFIYDHLFQLLPQHYKRSTINIIAIIVVIIIFVIIIITVIIIIIVDNNSNQI